MVWPSGWVCQAVSAPGVKWTRLACARAGADAGATASMKTSPVNQSPGPLAVSMLLLVISMGVPPVRWSSRQSSAAAGLVTEAGDVGRVGRRRPAPEEVQRLRGGAVGVRGVDGHGQPSVG